MLRSSEFYSCECGQAEWIGQKRWGHAAHAILQPAFIPCGNTTTLHTHMRLQRRLESKLPSAANLSWRKPSDSGPHKIHLENCRWCTGLSGHRTALACLCFYNIIAILGTQPKSRWLRP